MSPEHEAPKPKESAKGTGPLGRGGFLVGRFCQGVFFLSPKPPSPNPEY